MSAPDLIGPQLLDLLACTSQALDPSASRVFVNPGEVPWDNCCIDANGNEGQTWVRLISTAPLTDRRARTAGGVPCGVLGWVHTVGVGVLRCAHVLDDQGNPPSVDEITDDALQQSADQAELIQAILCCPAVTVRSVTSWTPLGPQGGCVGGEWVITLSANSCACPEDT